MFYKQLFARQLFTSKPSNFILRIDNNQLHALSTSPHIKLAVSNSNVVQKRNASAFKFIPEIAPPSLGETTKMNLYQSVTNALDISLSSDKSAGNYAFLSIIHIFFR